MIFLFVVGAGKRPFCSHTDTMPPSQRLDEGGREQFHAILVTLFKLTFQKSLGRKPVRFAMRESMRGPISCRPLAWRALRNPSPLQGGSG
jgi:hypothetical protein